MEPRIQYARTSDGVSIAYSEVGDGKPLIILAPATLCHAELAWQLWPFLHRLANRFRVVWLDWRGCGLSERDAIDFSMGAMMRDLEAVVARTGLKPFVLAAWGDSIPIAVTYATSHPGHVSHLILTDGYSRFSDFAQTAAYQALTPLVETDWMLFTETISKVLWAHTNPEFAGQFAEYMRACAGPEAALAFWKENSGYDAVGLLPQLTAPTLVVHNKSSRLFTLPMSRQTAAGIPGARLVLIDDVTYALFPELLEEFVFGGEAATEGAPSLASGTAVILFADIVDSTALTERLGDATFRAKARDLGPRLRALVRQYGGKPIEGPTLGDGVLVVFTSAREAIEAARRCARAGDDAGLSLHLGLHAGDVTREKDPDGRDNVYGGAVNIASRISGLSAPGEVLVSDTVRSLARTSAGVRFEDRGEQPLKGVGEPVRVWAVQEGPG